MNSTATEKPVKIGVFFSHPNQHHSIMFRHLSNRADVLAKIYYFDSNLGQHDPEFSNSEQWDIDLVVGTQSYYLRNLFRNRHYSQMRQLNVGVVQTMLREQFDAVYVSGYVIPSNWLVLLLSMVTGAELLYQSDTNILDAQRRRLHWFKRRVRKTFLGGVDTFLVAGDCNYQFYESIGVRSNRMIWCPLPVDVERFRAAQEDPQLEAVRSDLRMRYDIPPKAKIIVFSGKLIERKRPQDFIRALRKLDRDDVYGLMLGSGPLEDTLRRELLSTDRVRLAGFVNQSLMPYHLLLGDVGVVTSEWDPHPLITTEFAACSMPVVVSHYCGVAGEHDILRPGENGYTYECGNIDELVNYLTQLLDNEVLRRRMGQRSVELAHEQSAEYAAEVIVHHITAVRNGHSATMEEAT